MKIHLGILWLLALLAPLWAQPTANSSLEQAEKFFEEGSFQKAWEIYSSLTISNRPPAEQRWIQFRTADSLWRSEAASQRSDQTQTEEALKVLRELVADGAPQNSEWAAVHESLGDYHWTAKHWPDWNNAWTHYAKALEHWAGSTNLAEAAERYLTIVWKAADRPDRSPNIYWHEPDHNIPAAILENALRIVRTEEEKAHANYLLAGALRHGGSDWEKLRRLPQIYENAIALRKDTPWYDDALFNYAEWLHQNGRAARGPHGEWTFRPDYVRALELYRQLVGSYQPGESPYLERALQQIGQITRPSITASVPYTFEPGTEVYFNLHWRNVKAIDLALFRVSLTEDIPLQRSSPRDQQWLESIDLRKAEKVKSWAHATNDNGKHEPGNETIRLEESLPTGAYVLQTSTAGITHRELILVTDAALILKTSGSTVLAWVCDARTGSPLPRTTVKVWTQTYTGSNWEWLSNEGQTDAQGIFTFAHKTGRVQGSMFAAASIGQRQAFANVWAHHGDPGKDQWRIYATTDRPAYRPGETVQWKLTARIQNGQVYTTPAGSQLRYKVVDPRGAEVQQGSTNLNSFGSAWGKLALTSEMPLGLYHVIFIDSSSREIGRSAFFRLEEYKLPEFKVTVTTPTEEGRRKTFLPGEKVEVEIQADYYFGGPVANANVEVVVRQRPFHRHWKPHREFPWFYPDSNRSAGRAGQVIQRESLRTDAFGKARLTFQSPADAGENLEFAIEARVTDSSRREITANDVVRVTLQRYEVRAQPDHYLHRPGEPVEIEFTALDANDHPVAAEGVVQVTRDSWVQIWIDPDGREMRGEALAEARRRNPKLPGWHLKFQGYKHEHLLTQTVKTGTNGNATLSFTPPAEGYYRVTWRSEDDWDSEEEFIGRPVETETTLWVADRNSRHLGYHTDGIQVIVDQETFESGQTAPVLLVADGNDRHVLLTVESEDLISHQVVHLAGSVKLVHLPIGEAHIPNARLDAAMVIDSRLHQDSEEIVVPPVKNFLTVDLEPNQEEYRPGEEGRFTLSLKDHAGEPVSAEVALSLVDDSVFYIQGDLAGDPRRFFFGNRKSHRVNTGSSFAFRSYLTLLTERELALEEEQVPSRTSGLHSQTLPAAAGETRTYFARQRSLGEPADMAAPLMLAAEMPAMAKMEMKEASLLQMGNATEPPVQVRSDFRTTIFWEPAVQTGPDGKAEVTVRYPDSLTGWKATARAVTAGNQYGIGEANTRTKQPLIVRLQAPRFFQAGDVVTVSAILNNNTDSSLQVRPEIEIEGMSPPENAKPSPVTVPPQGEKRVDWVVHPARAGEAKITVVARAGEHNDAMMRSFTIHEHGIEKFLAISGKVRGEDLTVNMNLPRERKTGTTTMSVQVTPSMAVTMLDALPYLIHYPYGCTEQTMSRFLPAVITAKTLEDLGLHPEDVMHRAFGGIESATATATHPDGKKDLAQLDDIVRVGLQRLYDFQHADGGWGWWKEGDSDLFMSAYVLWGLVLAQQADVQVRDDVIERAANFLSTQLVYAERRPDLQAWMLHALAVHFSGEQSPNMNRHQSQWFQNLWNRRAQLNAYTRALLALAAHHFGYEDQAQTLVRNLENGVIRDDKPSTSVLVRGGSSSEGEMGTAHWGEDGLFWRWSDGGVEATAFVLKALMAIDPKNELVEPVTNWLIKNRRGAQWSNTRDTAISLLALNDYLRASGELETELSYTITVNGAPVAEKNVSSEDIFSAPSRFAIPAEHLRNGTNEIRITRTSGEGALYFAVETEFFSLEEPVTAAGNEIFVKREYYRSVPQRTLLNGYTLAKEKMKDGDRIESGDRVEVVVTVEAKNNYEYLVFEDLKPAGLEAVQIQSGQALFARELSLRGLEAKHGSRGDAVTSQAKATSPVPQNGEGYTHRSRYVYQELRDRKVALFIDKLPQGTWEIRYEMRAEVPGEFHALPVLGHAMYVPEIRCNSEEMHLEVTDRPETDPAT